MFKKLILYQKKLLTESINYIIISKNYIFLKKKYSCGSGSEFCKLNVFLISRVTRVADIPRHLINFNLQNNRDNHDFIFTTDFDLFFYLNSVLTDFICKLRDIPFFHYKEIIDPLNTFFLYFDLGEALILPGCFIILGFYGIIFCKNRGFIMLLLFIEMIVFGLSCGYILISFYKLDPLGHIYVLVLLTLAACDSVVGLSIIYRYFIEIKSRHISFVKNVRYLRG